MLKVRSMLEIRNLHVAIDSCSTMGLTGAEFNRFRVPHGQETLQR